MNKVVEHYDMSDQMTPIDRLKAGLLRVQRNGCKVDSVVQNVEQAYEKQANDADQRLQEKQEREQERFFS